jgi:3'(2'), 5'-bisphosphate nucleotidase
MQLPEINFDKVQEIALGAGKLIMEVYRLPDFTDLIDTKADNSPLTLADKKSNDYIVAGLKSLTPQIPIISEEEKEIPFDVRKNWSIFWLVDPLDGTKEFIKRNGEFTVNIGLIVNGYPVAGVIYAPALDEMYYGQIGKGSFKSSNGKTFPIKVSDRKTNLIAVGSRSHAAKEEEEFFLKFNVADRISKGSSLKFCLLAEGSADLYYRHGPTMEWDTGAGQAIVEASGGLVVNLGKKRFEYNKESLLNSSFICASDEVFLS